MESYVTLGILVTLLWTQPRGWYRLKSNLQATNFYETVAESEEVYDTAVQSVNPGRLDGVNTIVSLFTCHVASSPPSCSSKK